MTTILLCTRMPSLHWEAVTRRVGCRFCVACACIVLVPFPFHSPRCLDAYGQGRCCEFHFPCRLTCRMESNPSSLLDWLVFVWWYHSPRLHGRKGGGAGCPEHHGGRGEGLNAQSIMEVAVPAELVSYPCHCLLYHRVGTHVRTTGSGHFACSPPQAIGSFGAGLMDIEELHQIERCALPGSGACGESHVITT